MNLRSRVLAFKKLANHILQPNPNLLHQVESQNPWFIPHFINSAQHNIASSLNETSIEAFCERYALEAMNKLKLGVIMAGNIPAVGFHDFFCVLISGNHLYAKFSSKDQVLMQYLVDCLINIEPDFSEYIHVVDRIEPSEIDALIFTGTNNTATQIEYLFPNIPTIIRKNRSSVAVLRGDESQKQLKALSSDMFLYFGLGCRNVTKLFVPKNYCFDSLKLASEEFIFLNDSPFYRNNYLKQKALDSINQINFIDSNFYLLKASSSNQAPLAQVFYQEYDDIDELALELESDQNIQVVMQAPHFGEAQKPSLFDFADGVDTIQFLLQLK